MTAFESLPAEDAQYVQALWETYQPGIGVAEVLVEVARTLHYQLDHADEGERTEIEAELERVGRISRTLYDDNAAELAGALHAVESDPVGALYTDEPGLARPLGRMEELGEIDGRNGWVDTIVLDENRPEVSSVVYALRQMIHLSDTRPGDKLSQTPVGQATRHYWQGIARSLTEKALRSLDPGRATSDTRLLQQEARVMDALEFEEYVVELREEAASHTGEWLKSYAEADDEEHVAVLSSVHRYMMANDIATRRSREAVVHAFAEARSEGRSTDETLRAYAAEAIEETGFDPETIRELADGVIPGRAASELSLRNFRTARRLLEEERTLERDVDAPENDRPQPASGRGR